MKLQMKLWVLALLSALASVLTIGAPGLAQSQNDGGSGGDAGNTFAEATLVRPRGFYEGTLDSAAGDSHDFYKFALKEGAAVSVLVTVGVPTTDPIMLLDPAERPVDVGARVGGTGLTVSGAFTQEGTVVRLAVHRAQATGEYRLHLQSEDNLLADYALCFMNCEEPMKAPHQFFAGGALYHTLTRVLLVPPTHGDLGNPLGPTVLDYIDATVRGIHEWSKAIDAFTEDYPQFDYLREIEIHIEIFDAADPVDPAGYDIIIGYVAAGPAFRGVAADTQTRAAVNGILEQVGLNEDVHFSGRAIALSLFGSSPRAGQVLYDFPEVTDLQIVTTHEFGHTFGLGHTANWHSKLGPDLMNSPAPFIYGDGFTFGDGGERTKMKCLSSLNLYALAWAYRWVPTGEWEPTSEPVGLPKGIPYEWYC